MHLLSCTASLLAYIQETNTQVVKIKRKFKILLCKVLVFNLQIGQLFLYIDRDQMIRATVCKRINFWFQ